MRIFAKNRDLKQLPCSKERLIFLLIAILVLAIIVLIHELGHFTVAKLSGIEVKEFAIGFGPKLLSKKYKDTVYSIRAIPLGGFNDIDLENRDENKKDAFANKPYWVKVLLLVAGGGFNLISAFLALILMVLIYGTPTPTNEVKEISAEHIASQYLEVGDRILSVNGEAVNSKEIIKATNLVIEIERNNETKTIEIEKEANTLLGVTFGVENKPTTLAESIKTASNVFYKSTVMIFQGIHNLIFNSDTKLTENLAGPIGVTQAIDKNVKSDGMQGGLLMFVMISINLGYINLLPIPILDGGHVVVLTIEKIIRKPISEKGKEIIYGCGLAVLSVLFLIGMYADLSRIFPQ